MSKRLSFADVKGKLAGAQVITGKDKGEAMRKAIQAVSKEIGYIHVDTINKMKAGLKG